ncbi:hypothetical protein LWI29_034685 [Acer saccharum]|uniref:Uncharacterized protein n=1 Tax=Acer saccharum TaxID=4024 RepID=A0AA39SE29_ACESA|nr:hypothetical protein LWI29_034685 [Acer saccharum]
MGQERGETSNSDIHRRRHCEVFDGDGDNSDDFDDADDIRDDFDGSCTTPATPPTVPFNHASNSSLQSRFEIFALEVILTLAKEYATRRNVDPFPEVGVHEATSTEQSQKDYKG